MKVGILTYFRPINYGAYLQAYALSHRLNEESDIEAELINFHMPEEDELYDRAHHGKNFLKISYVKKRDAVFHNALSDQIASPDPVCGGIEEFIKMADGRYDVIIAGSDEIWKVDSPYGFPNAYFLPSSLHCKKMSYAASGRTPFTTLSAENQTLLREYLEDFAYIGVRDVKTKEEVEKLVSKTAHLNFDPTFIYDFKPNRERGKELIKRYFHVKGDKKVIAVMYGEGMRANPSLLKFLKDKRGFDIISLYQWNRYFKNVPEITPFEWIDIIAAADGMVTAFFHGTCFAILGGTPFYAVDKRSPNCEESKIYDLLQKLDIKGHFSMGMPENMDEFFEEVRAGKRLDPTPYTTRARDEFAEFIGEIRKCTQQKSTSKS